MSRALQDDGVTARHVRPVPAPRQGPAGESDVDLCNRVDELDDGSSVLPGGPRELAQDPRDLLTLSALGLTEPIGVLDDRERLDEERLAGARAVVHDSRHRATRRGAEREHRPPAALGDEVLREMLAQSGVTRERTEPLRDPAASLPQLAAETAKRGRRPVAQVASVVLDRTGDRLGDAGEHGIDALRQLLEAGDVRDGLDRATRRDRRVDRDSDRPQRRCVERAAASRDLRGLPHVVDVRELGLRRLLEQADGLARQRLSACDLGGLDRRLEREAALLPGLARRRGREAIEDRGQLQQFQGPWIHGAQCRAVSAASLGPVSPR